MRTNVTVRDARNNLPAWLVAGIVAAAAAAGCSGMEDGGSEGLGSESSAVVTTTTDAYLKAVEFQIPAGAFGNAAPITMWGYSKCAAGFASCAAATVPGPAIAVAEGVPFRIHLRNALAGLYKEPTSVVIPGQIKTMAPVWFDPATSNPVANPRANGDFKARVRSFDAEAPAGGTTDVVYEWPSPRAGTYLYQSGTHPAVQVQMGLYGALSVYPADTTRAYADASATFRAETTLLFSEIDPALHDAIALGAYGPNPPAVAPPEWKTSTVDYLPRFFLINGQSYSATALSMLGGLPNQALLLRFLNAGLETKAPVVLGPYMSVIAEDGNFFAATRTNGTKVNAPKQQYEVLLPAGKTIDAILTPTAAGNIPIFDRRLNLSNAGAAPGGMLTYLSVGP